MNQALLNNHFELLHNLSHDEKLILITWLSQSLMSPRSKETLSPLFNSEQSAEALIEEIRDSRLFNREREEL